MIMMVMMIIMERIRAVINKSKGGNDNVHTDSAV